MDIKQGLPVLFCPSLNLPVWAGMLCDAGLNEIDFVFKSCITGETFELFILKIKLRIHCSFCVCVVVKLSAPPTPILTTLSHSVPENRRV